MGVVSKQSQGILRIGVFSEYSSNNLRIGVIWEQSGWSYLKPGVGELEQFASGQGVGLVSRLVVHQCDSKYIVKPKSQLIPHPPPREDYQEPTTFRNGSIQVTQGVIEVLRFPIGIIVFHKLELIVFVIQGLTLLTTSTVHFIFGLMEEDRHYKCNTRC